MSVPAIWAKTMALRAGREAEERERRLGAMTYSKFRTF